MTRVFVVGAHLPFGGAWMAYQIGRILEREFGYRAVAVTVRGESPDHGQFAYDSAWPRLALEALPGESGENDLLVVNPSFSFHALGLTCRGRKIMYVQHFNTFDLLDLRCDLYVSVSGFVQRVLRATYGLTTMVIPPFIAGADLPEPMPWARRPAGSLLIHNKGNPGRQAVVLDRLRALVARRRPEIGLDTVLERGGVPHPAFLARLGRARFLLSLTPAEGFGLVPLEAMAMGTTVVGFDGFGGRDYLRPGENCAVVPWARIEDLADLLVELFDDPARAAALAAEGQRTAGQPIFTQEHFRAAWRRALSAFLGGS